MIKPFRSERSIFNLYASLYQEPNHAFLHSSLSNRSEGRYSYLACRPSVIFQSRGNQIHIVEGSHRREIEGNPFDVFRTLLKKRPPKTNAFEGGAIGYWGYDLKNHLEDLPCIARKDKRWPDSYWMFFDAVLVVDHHEQRMALCGNDDAISVMESVLVNAVQPESPEVITYTVEPVVDKNRYLAQALRIREYIAAGDVYEVNLTQRFNVRMNTRTWTPFHVFRALCDVSPSPYSASLHCGDFHLLSSSPECFLKVTGSVAESRPIKGTRPRYRDFWSDEAAYHHLLNSEKDRAENVMIVDLVRNDLSRVSEAGSVTVPCLYAIERFETVFQMVSTVRSVLRDDKDALDAVMAAFPPGSMTGAPKIRAMEIIEELEPTKRGIYSGALGWMGYDGSCHLSVIIRTLMLKDGEGYFQTGGAIVWDSEPEAEYQESLVKARGIINALESLKS